MKQYMKTCNFEIVRLFLLKHKEDYFSKTIIGNFTGLETHQVSKAIRCAWKLGWVSRKELHLHDNAFNAGKFSTCRTQYKIIKTDSWLGLYGAYKQKLREEKIEATK